MSSTIPFFITSSCNNAGVQLLNGNPISAGSSQACPIMAATCPSVNFGGPPGLCSSDNSSSIVFRSLYGVSFSIRCNSLYLILYRSRHRFTFFALTCIVLSIVLLVNPAAALKIICDRIVKCRGVCVPFAISVNIFSCLSLNCMCDAFRITTFILSGFTSSVPLFSSRLVLHLRGCYSSHAVLDCLSWWSRESLSPLTITRQKPA